MSFSLFPNGECKWPGGWGLGAISEHELQHGHTNPFPELQGLSEWEKQQLMDGVVTRFIQLNLCFRQRLGETTYLIFPSLINEKQPPSEREILEAGNSYTHRV